MKVTETKYIEESGYFRIKVDIETEKQKVIGFKIFNNRPGVKHMSRLHTSCIISYWT